MAAVDEPRTLEQIRHHYLVERALAERLRNAKREERRLLYSQVYDELFQRVTDHPQHRRKADPEMRARQVEQQLALLNPFLSRADVFVEIGPGDCALSFAVCSKVRKVYGVDVSREIADRAESPPNFELALSDGTSIPVPSASADLVYSNQLMEHLHPDDALEQLSNIHGALKLGGVYVCITPNRLLGPHDISQYFDHTATGLHLKEYTATELEGLFRRAGFARVQAIVMARSRCAYLPMGPVRIYEAMMEALPFPFRRRLAGTRLVRATLNMAIVATKSLDL